ncbi:MAG: DEAD/DEAH box helicase, partial [Arthrobacter sp.]|nr:DEAD/DEAH box helicase [Arthrobacter sp.]
RPAGAGRPAGSGRPARDGDVARGKRAPHAGGSREGAREGARSGANVAWSSNTGGTSGGSYNANGGGQSRPARSSGPRRATAPASNQRRGR